MALMYHGQGLITHHGHRPRSNHGRPCSNMVGVEKPCYHGQRLAGVSRPAVGVKSQAAQAQYESTWGCVIFKMTVIVKDLYGNSGNRFEKINTPWIFNKIRFALFTRCLLASCVVLFPIRCDLSDFHYPEFSLIKRGQGQTHAISTARRKKPKIPGQNFPTAKIPP